MDHPRVIVLMGTSDEDVNNVPLDILGILYKQETIANKVIKPKKIYYNYY